MSILHEAHDHHGQQTAVYARRLAEACGVPLPQVTMIETGAHLHDIGKLFLDTRLLNLPRKLEPAEFDQVKLHTTLGWAAVDQAAFDPLICTIVRSHHERFDGNGYPDGLSGDMIPFEARMVRIADTYAALLSPRSYRSAYSPDLRPVLHPGRQDHRVRCRAGGSVLREGGRAMMDADLKEYLTMSLGNLTQEISRLTAIVERQSSMIREIEIRSTTRVAELQKDIDELRSDVKEVRDDQRSMDESQKFKWKTLDEERKAEKKDRDSKDRIQAVVNNQIAMVNKVLWAIFGIVLTLFIGFVWQVLINGGLKGLTP